MEDMAVWIALGAVFIALIPAFAGKAAKARREEAEARKRGDSGVTFTSSHGESDGRKSSPDGGGADGGWGSDGGGGDGGGGGGD